MNLKVSVHNVLYATVFAAVGIAASRMLAQTPVSGIPVLGNFINFLAGA